MSEGKKFDQDKAPITLIPSETIIGMAEVLAMGAKKYGRLNWKNGIQYSRMLDAAYRHILAFQSGQDIDPESGKSHLLHAMINLSFLHHFQTTERTELDDRWEQTDES
jgi:hypothetical protein